MNDRHDIFGKSYRNGANRRSRSQQPTARGKKRRSRLGLVFLLDILAAGIVILFFVLINFVWIAGDEQSSAAPPESSFIEESTAPTVTDTAAVDTASPTDKRTPAPSPTKTIAPTGTWRDKFADKFTSGDVVKTDNSYKSANINVTVTKTKENGVTYFVADIYLADIKYFKEWFGGQTDPGTSKSEHVDAISSQLGGIIAINGDYCLNNKGLIIRNGKNYGEYQTSRDSLVMYRDGTMKTFTAKEFNLSDVKAQNPYQVWSFGPELLDDNGQAMTKFNSTVNASNPRTAIGYYEPGHYCFVVVDGRQPGYSTGYTTTQLSQLFHDKLKCKAAYNLDGGGSTQIAFLGKRINSPCSDYRKVCDMIYITDK